MRGKLSQIPSRHPTPERGALGSLPSDCGLKRVLDTKPSSWSRVQAFHVLSLGWEREISPPEGVGLTSVILTVRLVALVLCFKAQKV